MTDLIENTTEEAPVLEGGAYEIIRRRLQGHGATLRERVDQLNSARKEVFGGIEPELIATERVLTDNNCVPRDMVALGKRLLLGYNVQLGLRQEMQAQDVFSFFAFPDEGGLQEQPLQELEDPGFLRDFKDLYTYYKNTRFARFSLQGPHLFMVFRVGKDVSDIKTFKFQVADDGVLSYVDNRSDHELKFPPQHEFEWLRASRDMHREGEHAHISYEDRIFVESTGGDLTIKVEDNTETGEGIYSEPVEDPDQTLDDAEFAFASVGHLILLRVLPYREEKPRYLAYSEKVRQARRLDGISRACVLLPEDQGVIFSNGYYLQTGICKEFEGGMTDMMFDRRIASPNGEDVLYIFYNRESGLYVLLSYNIIRQEVSTPVECHGYCLFSDGRLVVFTAQEEAAKSHVVQVWSSPYAKELQSNPAKESGLLYKVGNRDVVRCMAGCGTLLGLLNRGDSYADLYVDIVRQATELLDSFFWMKDPEAFAPGEALEEIRKAASAAIAEFEKVQQLRHAAETQLQERNAEIEELKNRLRLARFDQLTEHVDALRSLRSLRGNVVGLRDLRYMDLEQVDTLEQELRDAAERQARRCIDFLLGDQALLPYEQRIEALAPGVEGLKKVSDGRKLEEELEAIASELEMLIETVGGLQIDDATQRVRITDGISLLFASLNQARAALKNRMNELGSVEGKAEFASQMKLLNQAVLNSLDVCNSPEACASAMSRVMLQVEELEGRFSESDEFILKIAEKREEVFNAFESRRVSLLEARNRRADTLMRSGERLLNSLKNRVGHLESAEEIHATFASDMMVEKLRDLIQQLEELGDPIKAGDLQTQLKTCREEALRQLQDREELFVGGENVIQFGRHRFAVNTQALDLTLLPREGDMMLHLTGTGFFERVQDETFQTTQDLWEQERVSENSQVSRMEYLAYVMLDDLEEEAGNPEALLEQVRNFMAPRYAEGYQKGVHDEDAAQLLGALLKLREGLGLLKTPPLQRALALIYWQYAQGTEAGQLQATRMRGAGEANRVFRRQQRPAALLRELEQALAGFAEQSGLWDSGDASGAAKYLFDILSVEQRHPISAEAGALLAGMRERLQKLAAERELKQALQSLQETPLARYHLCLEWLRAYLEAEEKPSCPEETLMEAAALLCCDVADPAAVATLSEEIPLEGLRSVHPRWSNGSLVLRYSEFMQRLAEFQRVQVPRFEHYQELKKKLLEETRQEMRLEEFMPRVLSSFVRNKLIDRVYLPLVGDNLAKQIGVVGKDTRTDRSGMLMLISPPGYGKTTLMEYIASRLGLVFMKINGPAIGHQVMSLDPSEAPNAAAREELHKLGLALEMGDNVMIYVDDIQHCNPEFLQKFISLCDAQRKIEGVYKGQSKTYDLRGKKVAVVMAGNPYTESGEKFRIPDMLANRADTYNLGDILGDHSADFELSFLENALTSNPALNALAAGNRDDVHALIQAASGDSEGLELKGRYTPEEQQEMLEVMRRMIHIRDVILAVNSEYIRSAGQADAYRTEPAFKLQGSYRNMSRLAGKVEAVMNEEELQTLIRSDYENESQTLTSGAEANLLKFKELTKTLSKEEEERWQEIKKVFARQQVMQGVGGDDRVGQAVAQLSVMGEGLQEIREAIRQAAVTPQAEEEILAGLNQETLARIEQMLQSAPASPRRDPSSGEGTAAGSSELSPLMARLLEQQFERWQEAVLSEGSGPKRVAARLKQARNMYSELLNQLGYGAGHE